MAWETPCRDRLDASQHKLRWGVLLVALKIRNQLTQALGIVMNQPECEIAVVTEPPAKLAALVAMVIGQTFAISGWIAAHFAKLCPRTPRFLNRSVLEIGKPTLSCLSIMLWPSLSRHGVKSDAVFDPPSFLFCGKRLRALFVPRLGVLVSLGAAHFWVFIWHSLVPSHQGGVRGGHSVGRTAVTPLIPREVYRVR